MRIDIFIVTANDCKIFYSKPYPKSVISLITKILSSNQKNHLKFPGMKVRICKIFIDWLKLLINKKGRCHKFKKIPSKTPNGLNEASRTFTCILSIENLKCNVKQIPYFCACSVFCCKDVSSDLSLSHVLSEDYQKQLLLKLDLQSHKKQTK